MPPEKFGKSSDSLDKTPSASEHQNQTRQHNNVLDWGREQQEIKKDSKPQNQSGTSDVMRWKPDPKEVKADSISQNSAGRPADWETASTASYDSGHSEHGDIIPGMSEAALLKARTSKFSIEDQQGFRKALGAESVVRNVQEYLWPSNRGTDHHEELGDADHHETPEERERIDSVVQEHRERIAKEKKQDEGRRSGGGAELQRVSSRQSGEKFKLSEDDADLKKAQDEWRDSGGGAELQRVPSRRPGEKFEQPEDAEE